MAIKEKSNSLILYLPRTNSAYIVKITLQNNDIVTKKMSILVAQFIFQKTSYRVVLDNSLPKILKHDYF
jgi:hypothetical protein